MAAKRGDSERLTAGAATCVPSRGGQRRLRPAEGERRAAHDLGHRPRTEHDRVLAGADVRDRRVRAQQRLGLGAEGGGIEVAGAHGRGAQLERAAGHVAAHPQVAERPLLVRAHAARGDDRRLRRARPPRAPLAQLLAHVGGVDRQRLVAVVRAPRRPGLRQRRRLRPACRQASGARRRARQAGIVDVGRHGGADATVSHHGDLDRHRLGRHRPAGARAQLALPPGGDLRLAVDEAQGALGEREDLVR